LWAFDVASGYLPLLNKFCTCSPNLAFLASPLRFFSPVSRFRHLRSTNLSPVRRYRFAMSTRPFPNCTRIPPLTICFRSLTRSFPSGGVLDLFFIAQSAPLIFFFPVGAVSPRCFYNQLTVLPPIFPCIKWPARHLFPLFGTESSSVKAECLNFENPLHSKFFSLGCPCCVSCLPRLSFPDSWRRRISFV